MAAVSPIGNTVYINQNMHTQAALQAGEQTKFETQVLARVDEFNNRDKIVEEVRPTEQNHAIDPDKEHEKQKWGQEKEQKERKANTEEEEPSEPSPKRGLLDISV